MILVYQAYGREDILQQSLFSIISLMNVLRPNSPLQVWIYTDHPDYFQNYFGELTRGPSSSLKILSIEKNQIQRWRGAIDFVHRVKIEILLEAARQWKGPLFYVDGDTYFRYDPSELFAQVNPRVSLMHIAEGVIAEGRDPLSKKIAKFLKKNTFVVRGADVRVPPQTVMWNAGAIGLARENIGLLEDILELTDQMHTRYPKHIQEQLAVSHYLQTRTNVISAEACIGHYWDQKDEFQVAIVEFLKRNTNWAMAKSDYRNFMWPAPPKPKIKKSFWSWLKIRA